MSDTIARIEKLENGFKVEVCDPKIAEKNRKPNSGYQDPYKAYSFQSKEDTCEFLLEVLDKLAPASEGTEYTSAFKKATSE